MILQCIIVLCITALAITFSVITGWTSNLTGAGIALGTVLFASLVPGGKDKAS